jgi:DNA-binding transcriptional regulator YhcF (GntR family)
MTRGGITMAKETNTNCEIIVDRVLDQITSGALKKGDKLPTERQLSESMNVSRASVREAIKSLESMGIAESIQGSGSYITDSPEKTINRPLCALFALSNGTLDNVLQLRIMIETNVCRDIILNARDDEIQAICSLADYDYIGLPSHDQAVLDARFLRLSKRDFDSLKTPSFLQNRIFAKNVASLPKALRSKTLAAIYPIRGGAPPALELPRKTFGGHFLLSSLTRRRAGRSRFWLRPARLLTFLTNGV